jgi:hypothetical protein
MFDEHLDRQLLLNYFVRGPEWAIAIPKGDVEALEDAMRRCSTFWNGPGTLLIPVTEEGRLPRLLDFRVSRHGCGHGERRKMALSRAFRR